MEVTGKVERILPAVSGQTKSGDTWQKQTFLLRTTDEYDNLYPIEAFGKAMEHMGNVEEGDNVTAHFNVKTNEYQGKYYVSLGLWKIEKEVKAAPQQTPAAPKPTAQREVPAHVVDDSLPF